VATNSLERGLAVMKTIGDRRGGMTNAEVSRQLDIPKSTCSYILTRLEREGFLIRHDATGRYKIGLSTLSLANDALREVGFLSIAEPFLYQLAESTGLVAILGALVGDRVLTVDRVESLEFLQNSAEKARSACYPSRQQRGVGVEYSLHASALGRAILAHLSAEQSGAMMAAFRLPKFPSKTNPSRVKFLAELEKVREQGCSVSDPQMFAEAFAIAAPIFDAKGVRGCICITQSHLSPDFRDVARLMILVKRAGREISRRLANSRSASLASVRPAEGAARGESKSGFTGLCREGQNVLFTN
jgi:DNA-binding IclR family transcriptional regulator